MNMSIKQLLGAPFLLVLLCSQALFLIIYYVYPKFMWLYASREVVVKEQVSNNMLVINL